MKLSSILYRCVLFLFFAGIIFILFFYYTAIYRLPLKKRKIILGGKEFIVFVAQTETEREKGLQRIIWMPKNMGMLFLFPRADRYCFWNKNTHIPLKLIFRRKEKVVQESFLPPISKGAITVCPQEPVDSVIEVGVN
ncbi:MAG: DUF192 domain-containing protein [Candidatus Omnitrophota bacterium]